MTAKKLYDVFGGENGIRRLCSEFYKAMDDLPEVKYIRDMHSQSLVDVEQKLYEYLSGWLGGPSLYLEKYGKVCLSDPHKPYAIGPKARDQWLYCMEKAMEAAELEENLKALMREPFYRIADAVRNKDVDVE